MNALLGGVCRECLQYLWTVSICLVTLHILCFPWQCQELHPALQTQKGCSSPGRALIFIVSLAWTKTGLELGFQQFSCPPLHPILIMMLRAETWPNTAVRRASALSLLTFPIPQHPPFLTILGIATKPCLLLYPKSLLSSVADKQRDPGSCIPRQCTIGNTQLLKGWGLMANVPWKEVKHNQGEITGGWLAR